MPARKRANKKRAKPNRPHKVLVYLVRGESLLVFQRESRGKLKPTLEVPKGGLARGESGRRAARRECLEESGVRPGGLSFLAELKVTPANRKRPRSWHAYWARVPESLPDVFVHEVTGSGKDRGRRFHYHFEPLASLELVDPQGDALPPLRAQLGLS